MLRTPCVHTKYDTHTYTHTRTSTYAQHTDTPHICAYTYTHVSDYIEQILQMKKIYNSC